MELERAGKSMQYECKNEEFFENAKKHFCTITKHKWAVMKGCFRVGLFRQGLMHDMSKYSPTEFRIGCKYFQGNMSPNNVERKLKGYTSAWLHHKGRNKHHYEYWMDYHVNEDGVASYCGSKMPVEYVVEMFIDRMAASKIYQGDAYTNRSALDYYRKGMAASLMHPDTARLLNHLLVMLAKRGERKTMAYIRKNVLKKGYPY